MHFKKARKLRDILLTAGFLITLGAYIYEPLAICGVVVMCSCLIPHFLFYKCPHCGRLLGRNEGKYCQFCGNSLDK